MIKYKKIWHLALVALLFTVITTAKVAAQDTEPQVPAPAKIKPVKNTFESVWVIDNQTVKVNQKKTLEFDMQHRFGLINNGYQDLWGIYAPSNIRIGFSYVPVNNLQLGLGICKDRMQWDGSVKFALTKQNNGKMPVSITYFGNAVVDTRDKKFFVNDGDRLSYFNSLMIARKINKRLSLQVSGNYSHFNNMEGFLNAEKKVTPKLFNDHFSVSCLGRFKVSDNAALMLNYDQPLTKHNKNNPYPNISFGIELSTSAHQFQIFMGNYSYILPQNNNLFNQNDFTTSRYVIGFNITRLWNY